MRNENTSIVASFTDQAAADVLAKCIRAAARVCEVTTSDSPGLAEYHVCVPTDSLAAVARLLDMTQIAVYDDPMSAGVVAGRLTCESIPWRLGGRGALDGLGFVGRYSGPYSIFVPKAFVAKANGILDEPPVSDSELTELALRTAPGEDDSP
jgi:hypothetical protein